MSKTHSVIDRNKRVQVVLAFRAVGNVKLSLHAVAAGWTKIHPHDRAGFSEISGFSQVHKYMRTSSP